MLRRNWGNWEMKRFVVTALGAAATALLGASSAAQAAMIDFTVIAIGGTPTYTGTSLDQSTAVERAAISGSRSMTVR